MLKTTIISVFFYFYQLLVLVYVLFCNLPNVVCQLFINCWLYFKGHYKLYSIQHCSTPPSFAYRFQTPTKKMYIKSFHTNIQNVNANTIASRAFMFYLVSRLCLISWVHIWLFNHDAFFHFHFFIFAHSLSHLVYIHCVLELSIHSCNCNR